MRRLVHLFIYVIYTLFSLDQVHCQQLHFRNLNVEQGLSQSQVYSITQDDKGNLVTATNGGGVCIYNGKDFQVLTEEDGLNSNYVKCVYKNLKGTIWIGTDKGVNKIDGLKLESFHDSILIAYTVRTIISDDEDHLLIGTYGNGLFDFDIKQGTYKRLVVPNNNIRSIIIDSKRRIWIGSNNGVSILNPDRSVLISFETLSPIWSIVEDLDGSVWIGTYGSGLYRYSVENISEKAELFNIDNGINNNDILGMHVDRSGNIWVGTDGGGVNKVSRNKTHNESGWNIEFITELEGLSNIYVLSVFEDREDNIWFGTSGGGLSMLANSGFTTFRKPHGLSNDFIMSVTKDSEGNIWLGSLGGGLSKFRDGTFTNFNTQNGLCDNVIRTILEDNSGNLWLGTYGGGLCTFDPKTFESFGSSNMKTYDKSNKLNDNTILCSLKDEEGNLWFGTGGSGLSKLENHNGIMAKKFIHYSTEDGLVQNSVNCLFQDHQQKILWIGTDSGLSYYKDGKFNSVDGLTNNQIRCIAEDNNYNLWIAGHRGLTRISNPAYLNRKFKYYSRKDGLISNTVYVITYDNFGNLIIGTNKGIDKIELDEQYDIKAIRSYTTREGFAGIECNGNAIFNDQNEQIWFGTVNGAIKYDPGLDKSNKIKPQTHLIGVDLFYKEVSWGNENEIKSIGSYASVSDNYNLPNDLSLNYNNNHITFRYIGISLTIPEKVKYQTYLEGFDNSWLPITDKIESTYSNLPPGDYTYYIKACNNDGIWNEEPTTFSFTIQQPLWSTWWFKSSVTLSIVGCILAFIKFRERSLINQRIKLQYEVRTRTDEIEEQKDQIELQRDDIIQQKELVDEKNKEITSSIRYAKQIQEVLLPSQKNRDNFLNDHFLLFKPKDIVSGDFYWGKALDDQTSIWVVADCTGHGVPGAFMSMLGNSLLNEIVGKRKILDPGQILNDLRTGVINTLGQTGEQGKSRDGMDVALTIWHKKKREIEFAGAYNPLYIIRKDIALSQNSKVKCKEGFEDLLEIKGTKQPIAFEFGKNKPFITEYIKVKKGDLLYTFSDGYPDQFGGPKDKKFTYGKFKKLLISIQEKSMSEQNETLTKTLNDWMQNCEQTDDISVIGVRIS